MTKPMKSALLLVACLIAALVPAAPAPAASFPQKASPPGQIHVVSANAWQRKVIGVKRFEMMLELARAMLKRPTAFDGGSSNAVAAPDLIVMQEMQAANLEIFANLLRQRSDTNYQIAGSTSAFGKFIINAERIAIQGEAHVWNDVCYAAAPPGEDGEPLERMYQWAEFVELETGLRFTASSIHLDPRSAQNTGQHACWDRNVPEIRRQMDLTPVPSIIAGDFNKRAVESTHECDPEEQSTPLSWYSMLTAPQEGRVYGDAVKDFHRQRGLSMATEWTHEQKTPTVTCDSTTRFRRNRIDYIFTSGMEVAEAHADHPGWSGDEPGSRHPVNKKYSDHRFISARLKLVGPPRPLRPVVVPDAFGVMHVSWQAIPDVPISQWLLYRAVGREQFNLFARLDPEVLTYDDFSTKHGTRYRYALAAVAPIEGSTVLTQGVESRPSAGVADALGPQVKSTTPRPNASGVERRTDIIARFDEPIDPTSVGFDTMKLYKGTRRICGRTVQLTRRFIAFEPCNPLGKKKQYTVKVSSVVDKLGNRGSFHSWRFTTR